MREESVTHSIQFDFRRFRMRESERGTTHPHTLDNVYPHTKLRARFSLHKYVTKYSTRPSTSPSSYHSKLASGNKGRDPTGHTVARHPMGPDARWGPAADVSGCTPRTTIRSCRVAKSKREWNFCVGFPIPTSYHNSLRPKDLCLTFPK